MRGKHRKDQPTFFLQKEDLEETKIAYSCGCGKTYNERGKFKKHSIQMHYGFFVEKSSHYLTNLTQVVLPVRNGAPINIQSEQVQREDEDYMLNREEISIKKQENEGENQKLKNEQVQKNRQAKKDTKFERKEGVDPQKERVEAQQKELIEWNGFRLIRNRRIQSKAFFCGQCILSFSKPQDYVVHCIEICQELKDLRSSHFIYSHLDDQTEQTGKRSLIKPLQDQLKKSPPKEEPVQKYPGKRRGRKKKIVNPELNLPEPLPEVAAVHYDAEIHRESIVMEPTSDIDGLRYIHGITNEYSERIFTCGQCVKIYNCKSYMGHIKKFHSEVVPKDSSHIIIRYQYSSSKNFNRLMPVEQPAGEPEMTWSCPCRSGAMTYASFVEHQMDVHFGISMIYPKIET